MDLFRDAAESAGISYVDDLPEGVQISVRTNAAKTRYLFVTNLSRKTQHVTLMQPGYSLLGETKIGPELEMEPYGVEIVVLSN